MFQQTRRIWMYRQNTTQLLVVNTCALLYTFARLFSTFLKVEQNIAPILAYNRIVNNLHGSTHQLKSHVLRQFNNTSRLYEAAKDFRLIRISIVNTSLTTVGYWYEAKWLCLAEIKNTLEASKTVGVIAEILRKLIPDKHKCLQVVSMNNLCYPINHLVAVESENLDVFFVCHTEYLVHKRQQRLTCVFFKTIHNVVNAVASK